MGSLKRQLISAPGHVVVDVNVVYRRDRPVAGCKRCADACSGLITASCGYGVVKGIQQPHACFAFGGACIDTRMDADFDPASRCFNKPPIPASIPTSRTDASVDAGRAACVVQVGNQCDVSTLAAAAKRSIGRYAATVLDAVAGHQADGAAVVHQAIGFESSGVVDNAALQPVGRLGRHDDQTTRGQHRLAVVDQGGHSCWLDANICKA